jgi:hypothetical protein
LHPQPFNGQQQQRVIEDDTRFGGSLDTTQYGHHHPPQHQRAVPGGPSVSVPVNGYSNGHGQGGPLSSSLTPTPPSSHHPPHPIPGHELLKQRIVALEAENEELRQLVPERTLFDLFKKKTPGQMIKQLQDENKQLIEDKQHHVHLFNTERDQKNECEKQLKRLNNHINALNNDNQTLQQQHQSLQAYCHDYDELKRLVGELKVDNNKLKTERNQLAKFAPTSMSK